MEWWQAAILGLVEGITEYLPVSSTGHLIIATELMRFDAAVRPQVDAFNIVIQGGAILAVLGLYRERVWQMITGSLRALKLIATKDNLSLPARMTDAYTVERGFRLAVNIFVAFVPAVILGLALDEYIEFYLFSTWPVLAALFLGGLWMIWLDRWRRARIRREDEQAIHESDSRFRKEVDDLSVKGALLIGLFQCVAMWPGTSRSMMTIAGGTLLGLKPRAAAEFSFLLGLPTLGGACVYKLAKNMYEAHKNSEILAAGGTIEAGESTRNIFEALGWAPVVIGLLVATVSAALAVKWLVGFLTRHGLAAFGWYRLVLCLILGTLVLGGWVAIG